MRILYGPEYTSVENMQKLKVHNTARKRALALKEYACGIETLTRFIKNEPLNRVFNAIFAILAFESEAIDPRL